MQNQDSVQFSSVAQSGLTLCNPLDYSMPGFPVHYQLPSLLKLMSIESGMPPSHLILCRPLLLLLAKPFFARPAVLDGVVSSPLVHVLSPYPAVHRYAFSGLRLWAVPCTSLSGSLPSPESVCLATWLARCVPRGDTRVVFPPCCQGSLAHLHHLC